QKNYSPVPTLHLLCPNFVVAILAHPLALQAQRVLVDRDHLRVRENGANGRCHVAQVNSRRRCAKRYLLNHSRTHCKPSLKSLERKVSSAAFCYAVAADGCGWRGYKTSSRIPHRSGTTSPALSGPNCVETYPTSHGIIAPPIFAMLNKTAPRREA